MLHGEDHMAGWDPCNLHNLAHISCTVPVIAHRSHTTEQNETCRS